MSGQSWCKSSVSKHNRIRLSLPFPVCTSLDFGVQVRSYIRIRYTFYTRKRQPSSAVIGKHKVNRFFVKFFDWIGCSTTVKALTLPMVAQNKEIAPVERV